MFLRNFSFVPDDRLHWCVTPTSKSPLRIAAHTALHASRFAKMIRDRRLPQPDELESWLAQREAEELALTTREEVETAFRKGLEEVLAALDSLSDADVEMSLDTGFGSKMPMKQVMNLPGWHATLHLGQIDFLQTCWDDQHVYV